MVRGESSLEKFWRQKPFFSSLLRFQLPQQRILVLGGRLQTFVFFVWLYRQLSEQRILAVWRCNQCCLSIASLLLVLLDRWLQLLSGKMKLSLLRRGEGEKFGTKWLESL